MPAARRPSSPYKATNELIILVVKMPTLYDHSVINEFQRSIHNLFMGVIGYDIKTVFVPTSETETKIECIFPTGITTPADLDLKLSEIMEEVESLHTGKPTKRMPSMDVWFGDK